MLIGIVLVIFAFNLALPISQLSTLDRARHARHRARLRAAVVPDDDHALQGGAAGDRLPVDGERPVLRRHRATYGMPMVVELGIALDVLVGMLILGVFMFQIREQFDCLDIRHLEKLKED